MLVFFEHGGITEQTPHEQAACSHPGPKPFAQGTQLFLLYGHVARVLQISCEHGLIEMHLPLTQLVDPQSGFVPTGQLLTQILNRGH